MKSNLTSSKKIVSGKIYLASMNNPFEVATKVFGFILILVLFSSCATIIDGTSQNISVSTSSSKRISGTIDGRPFSAPGTVNVERSRNNKILVIEKPSSCQRTNIIIPRKFNYVFLVNILSGGFLGSTTDFASGAMWKYQDAIHIPCD